MLDNLQYISIEENTRIQIHPPYASSKAYQRLIQGQGALWARCTTGFVYFWRMEFQLDPSLGSKDCSLCRPLDGRYFLAREIGREAIGASRQVEI